MNKREKIMLYEIKDLIMRIPKVKNKTDVKGLSDFHKEVCEVREYFAKSINFMIEGDLEQAREFIEYGKKYLSERQKVWDHEEPN